MAFVRRASLRRLALVAAPAAGLLLGLASLGGATAETEAPVARADDSRVEPRSRPQVTPAIVAQVRARADERSADARGGVRTKPKLRVSRWTLDGRVVDTAGNGISGARVFPSRAPGSHGLTGATGAFRLDAPAVLDHLVVEAPGYRAVGPPRRTRHGVTTLITMAPAAATLVVRVVSAETLAPLPRATVRAEKAGPSAVAGGDGGVHLEGLAIGESLGFEVSCPGHTSARIEVTATALAGAPVVVELEPTPDLPLARGTVVGAGGRPVPGALLRCGTRAARTGLDGTFRIEVPGDAHGELSAFHPRLGVARISFVPGEVDELRLCLDASTTDLVTLRVEDAGSLRVVPAGPGGAPDPLAPPWLTARPDAEGTVRVPAACSSDTWFVLDKEGQVIETLSAPGETEGLAEGQ